MLTAVPNIDDKAAVPKKGDVIDHPWMPLTKQPLPAGRPRSWYIAHNRRLKAMRLAIALLDAGAFGPDQAPNEKIRRTADDIGLHWPSDATCRMVRRMMQAQR
ncbi:hypothetical protein [Nocardia huaxiensis]|uniref:Uncharacterized protein n=1 Tax=Nocardia huaxiensis TaxID=2755382 RepID=A0A7D6VLG4_9NOCA|nr:hypothetical protein [Nocardia huaxiensis]QLY32270.1 hypothetical protein H0264_08405 [Nocardia huaxiensis]UFS94026.1 hypothetical protein LPY97_25015 [Nocardia huaxiensis]